MVAMTTILKARIVKIGNSQGIRIPKALLEQAGLETDVELDVQPNQIVIRSAHPSRHNWDQRFDAMAA
jgi:antitoxin MazE